ncbi:MAG: glycosyltransferase [Thermoprotei archaeon]|nr:glycosyltransferase [Thermoprotei archaeon]
MRVGVVHHRLTARGGGEFLAMVTIEALRDADIDVWLISNDSSLETVSESIRTSYGRELKVGKHIRPLHGLLSGVNKFSLYQRILVMLTAKRLLEGGKLDLIINTHGDMIPFSLKGKYILYCHYPTSLAIMESPRYKRFPLNLYARPYVWLLRKWKPSGEEIVLTNSNFTKAKIKEVWGVEADVVYPPVDIRSFWNEKREGREASIVSVGRFVREKRFEVIIKAFSKVAEEVEGSKLYLIGSSQATGSIRYMHELRELAKKLSIENRVIMMPDAPFADLLDVLGRCKVYVHAMVNEHFGISVVQAMASGLAVIVHKSGGPYEDIIEKGRWGLAFEDVDELSEKIYSLLSDEDLWNHYSSLSLRRAHAFSEDEYKVKIIKYVDELAST